MAKNELKILITGEASKLKSALGDAGSDAEGFAGKFKSMGPMVAAGGAAVAAAAVGIGVAAYKMGEEFDDAYDTIRVGTGATGAALDALQGDFKAVVSSVPTDFASASTALTDINQRLGLTGKPLQDVSKQMLELSRITKTDVGANIEATTGALNNFGIKAGDQGPKLDLLFRASQATGISVADLAKQMSESGGVLRSVGLDFDDSAALLGGLSKAGVSAADVMPALSKTMAAAAKDGKNASDVLDDLWVGLQKAPDDASAASLAMETLGAKAGPKFAEAIRSGRLNYDDLLGSIQTGKDTILGAGKDTQDFGEKWTMFKNKAMVALEPVVTKVFGAVGDLMGYVSEKGIPIIKEFGSRIADWLVPIFQTLSAWWAENGPAIIAKVQALGDKVMPIIKGIGEIVAQVVEWIGDLWDRYGDLIMDRVKSIFNFISNIVSAAMNVVKGIIDVVMGLIHGDWGRVWNGIKGIVGGVWDAIKAIISFAWDTIKQVFTAAGRAISDIWSGVWGWIKGIVGGAWDWITSTVSNGFNSIVGFFRDLPGKIAGFAGSIVAGAKHIGSSIWQGIVDGISGAANFIGDLGKKIWNGIAGFINDKLISPIGRFKVNIPIIGELTPFSAINNLKIPKLAQGGIVTGPTLALLGDNRSGREAVVPLEKSGAMGFGGGGATFNITINAGAVPNPAETGRQIVEYIRRYEGVNGPSWRAA